MNSDNRDWIYRHYVANSLSLIPQNKYYQETLMDMLEPVPIDYRTAEDITEDVVKKTGIVLLD